MDDVMCDFSAAHRAKRMDEGLDFPQRFPGFFRDLAPIPNAIHSVNILRERFDVYVLTAPSIRNPHCYSEKRIWIEEHFGLEFTNKLILSPNKGLLKGDFLVDDHAEGRGQENFEGELIQFGTAEYPDWSTVLEYFGLSLT